MEKNNLADLPFSETHVKSADGNLYVMKEKYAIPYRESLDVQLKSWLEGKPVHNTFANECCPDFSCCHPELLWDEDRRKTFANASPLIRETMMSDAMFSLLYPDIKVHIAGQADVSSTKH